MRKAYIPLAVILGLVLGYGIGHPPAANSQTNGLQIVGNCIKKPNAPGPGLCQNEYGFWGVNVENALVQLQVQQHVGDPHGTSEIAMCKDVVGVNASNCIVIAIHTPDDIGGGLEDKAYLALTGGASAKELQIRSAPNGGVLTFQAGCDTNNCPVLTLRGP